MPSRLRARPPDGHRIEGAVLDARDRQILDILSTNARISTSELARQVGMSAPAVRERVNRLEETGVIRGYRADIDPAALGLPVAAWVRVRPGPGQLPKIAELARRSPEVAECHRITGDDCFLLKVHGRSIEGLEALLDSFLMFGQTTTAVVVATPVPPRSPMVGRSDS